MDSMSVPGRYWKRSSQRRCDDGRNQKMPRVRSKAYKVTLPSGSYTEDDLGKIEKWAFDNCYRTAIVRTDDNHTVWVAIREKTWSRGDWMRHVRGVFHTLKLDVRPLAGEGWLALSVELEALEIIRAAGRRICRTEP